MNEINGADGRAADGIARAPMLGAVLDAVCGALVVWDFDGVIADTEPLHAASYWHVLQTRGYRPSTGFFDDLIGRTEAEIWNILALQGAPVDTAATRALMAERQSWFLARALKDLRPTWVARALVPAAARTARGQVIVSNGEPSTLTVLLRHWGLDRLQLLPRPSESRDKASVLEQLCADLPVLLIEDNPGYLRLGRSLGAFTVAVRHDFNRHAGLEADVLLDLQDFPHLGQGQRKGRAAGI